MTLFDGNSNKLFFVSMNFKIDLYDNEQEKMYIIIKAKSNLRMQHCGTLYLHDVFALDVLKFEICKIIFYLK